MNRVIQGDCRDVMRSLIAEGVRVQCVVTSPPYWGLRDYGVDGQLGLERTYPEFIANMVEVFDLVRQLLADDGTLWLNMGDSYAQSGGRGWQGKNGQRADRRFTCVRDTVPMRDAQRKPDGLKPKDLVGIPWRLAFALQDAGWWLRQDIIWSKPNPMPESVRDRCTKAHEYLFLMAKSERYYFDQDAILEECSPNTHARLSQDVQAQIGSERAHAGGKTNGNMKAVARTPGNVNPPKGQRAYEAGDESHRTKGGLLAYAEKHRKLAESGSGTKNNASFDAAMAIMPTKRNRRSVWTVTTQPYKEAHFATMPESLVEPCVLAGSRPGDIVFDPFLGSGTVAAVAQRLGRRWVGAELNSEYIKLIEDRTRGTLGLELSA